jgi:tRNA dimethylallyltransferase
MKTPLFFLSGPTASGKTDLAHALAEHMGLRLLSVDSMMVYRGMNIGTAKPSAEEITTHDYAGLNLVNPGTPFSVGDWLRAIRSQLDDRPTLAVGGTGLYFRALVSGLEDGDVPTPEDLPDDLPGLQERLRRADPEALNQLADPENPRRLARAIAWREAGKPLPSSWNRPQPVIPVLHRPPEELAERIGLRARQMFDHGLLEETETLLNAGTLTGTAAQAIGYAEAAACLEGTLTKDQAIENTATRTRQYAKRQRTWFRNQMHAEWIDCTADATDRIQTVWNAQGPFLFG